MGKMDKKALDRHIRSTNPSALYIDGFDEAIIGTTTFRDINGNRALIAYSVQIVLEILAEKHPTMTASELAVYADEHFFDSFEGDNTPIFIDQFCPIDLNLHDSATTEDLHVDDEHDEEISTARIIAATEAYMNLAEADPEFEKLLDEEEHTQELWKQLHEAAEESDDEKPADPPTGEHDDTDPKDLYEF